MGAEGPKRKPAHRCQRQDAALEGKSGLAPGPHHPPQPPGQRRAPTAMAAFQLAEARRGIGREKRACAWPPPPSPTTRPAPRPYGNGGISILTGMFLIHPDRKSVV